MSLKIGEIFVSLGLSTASFTTNLNNAKKLAFGSAKEMERSFRLIGTAVGSMAVAAGTAFAFLVKNQISAAAALHDLSLKTGVSVESLSRLGHAAKLSGVDTDLMAKGLQKLQKNAVEAALGNKELTRWFKAFEIDVKDAGGAVKGAEQLFLELSDRMRVLGVDSRNSGIMLAGAIKLMEKSGADLLPLLMENLRETGKEADRLGITVSTKTGASADKLEDSLIRLTAAAKGAALGMADELLPILIAVADRANDGVPAVERLGKSIGRWFIRGQFAGMAGPIVDVVRQFNELRASASKVDLDKLFGGPAGQGFAQRIAAGTKSPADILKLLAGGDEQAAAAAKKRAEAIQSTIQGLQDEVLKLQIGADAFVLYELQVKKATTTEIDFARSLQETIKTLQDSAGKMIGPASLLDTLTSTEIDTSGFDRLSDALKRGKELWASTLNPLEQYVRKVREWKDLLDLGVITTETFKNAQDQLAQSLGLVGNAAENANPQLEELRATMRGFAEQSLQAFEQWIVGGGSFRGVLQGILQDLARMVLQLLVIKPLMNSILGAGKGGGGGGGGGGLFGFLGSLFGGLFGGGGGINIGASNFPGAFSPEPFAHGGPVGPGRSFLVGERGPELFLPRVRGDIVPNHALRAGGAGVTNVFHIDNRGADLGTQVKTAAMLDRWAMRHLAEFMHERQTRTA